jgi:Leucine-rich repeat (LRR) protein
MKHCVVLFFALVLLAAGCFGQGKDKGDQPVVIGGYANNRTLNDIKARGSIYITLAEDESKDLSGIEQLADVKVTEFNLRTEFDVKEVDLTPLRHLQHLKKVALTGIGLTAIPDFSSSPSIRRLEIYNGSLTSFDGIETMPLLEEIIIDQNNAPLINISVLRRLQNLQYLYLSGSQMNMDFSILKDLPALQQFEAGETVDLGGISQLKSLQKLTLWGYGGSIANLEEIGRMPWLKELFINDLITSVEFLAGNTNLEDLELIADRRREDYLTVSLPLDVSPLKNLTNLKRLAIRGFDLQNAEGLDQLPSLEYFNTEPYQAD